MKRVKIIFIFLLTLDVECGIIKTWTGNTTNQLQAIATKRGDNMKASIVEITEWYNSKGQLIEHSIVYESGRKCGCFEQLPKTAEKWLERVKKSAEYTEESKVGDWTKKVYRAETHKE